MPPIGASFYAWFNESGDAHIALFPAGFYMCTRVPYMPIDGPVVSESDTECTDDEWEMHIEQEIPPEALIGVTVRKKFSGYGVSLWTGEVISRKPGRGQPRYTIRWSDGSETVLTHSSVLKHMTKQQED